MLQLTKVVLTSNGTDVHDCWISRWERGAPTQKTSPTALLTPRWACVRPAWVGLRLYALASKVAIWRTGRVRIAASYSSTSISNRGTTRCIQAVLFEYLKSQECCRIYFVCLFENHVICADAGFLLGVGFAANCLCLFCVAFLCTVATAGTLDAACRLYLGTL